MRLDNWVWAQSAQLEDWTECEWVQLGGLGLGRLGMVSVGAAGKTGGGIGWSIWGTVMMLVDAGRGLACCQ